MKLKKFSTNTFAGLNDVEVEFKDDLNVFFGPNEAGKSTIVKAIYAALFVEPKLRYNYSDLRGKEFRDRFLPYHGGDFVDGKLKFSLEGNEYEIYKKWSNESPDGYLELPGGGRIADSIKEKSQEIIPFGKSTFKNIVFTKQEAVKSFLTNITDSNEEEISSLKSTVGNFLRNAVMELGGVSPDDFKNNLQEKYEELTNRWDRKNLRPANPDRDVENPYQQDTGKIYDEYIRKESIRQEIKDAKTKEKNYQEIKLTIEDLEAKKEKLEKKRDELSEIEADINQRQRIESYIDNIKEKLEKLNEIHEKWPKKEEKLAEKREELQGLKTKLDELKSEKERAEKIEKRKELEEKIEEIDKLKEGLSGLKESKKEYEEIEADKVNDLNDHEKKYRKIETQLEAGKLVARVKRSDSADITVKPGIEAEKSVDVGEEVEADGFIRIITEHAEIEVESAKIDFQELQENYQETKEKYNELREKLDVEDADQAQNQLAELNEIKKEIKLIKEKIQDRLEEREYGELKKELAELQEIEAARKEEEIEQEINSLQDDINDLKVDIGTMENKIEEWKAEYETVDNLKEKIADFKTDKKDKCEKLAELAELPEEYDTPEEFKTDLKEIRSKFDEFGEKIKEKYQDLYRAKEELSDKSTDEMKEELKESEEKFNRLVRKAEKYAKILEIVESKLGEVNQKSFQPLIDSFTRYLQKLTAGKYQAGIIADDFGIELEDADGRRLPADRKILSYGTYDSVALALRFALFENLFQYKDGFIVLDDCLVNLDSERKEAAIELIKEFSGEYQILFSTCNRETAEELGGNVIKL